MKLCSLVSRKGFSNTFILSEKPRGAALVLDPGFFDEQMLQLIEGGGLRVSAVLLTHCHRSHVDGLRTMARIYQFELYCYLPRFMEHRCEPVRDGARAVIAGLEVLCLHTPGHSADSVSYKIGRALFTGDTLMAGEIGSTSDPQQRRVLLDSIWAKILSWPADTLIFPGHGPPTTVGLEKRFNPALACAG